MNYSYRVSESSKTDHESDKLCINEFAKFLLPSPISKFRVITKGGAARNAKRE
jgi:hypothetical protein